MHILYNIYIRYQVSCIPVYLYQAVQHVRHLHQKWSRRSHRPWALLYLAWYTQMWSTMCLLPMVKNNWPRPTKHLHQSSTHGGGGVQDVERALSVSPLAPAKWKQNITRFEQHYDKSTDDSNYEIKITSSTAAATQLHNKTPLCAQTAAWYIGTDM